MLQPLLRTNRARAVGLGPWRGRSWHDALCTREGGFSRRGSMGAVDRQTAGDGRLIGSRPAPKMPIEGALLPGRAKGAFRGLEWISSRWEDHSRGGQSAIA